MYYKIEPISELTDTPINHTILLTFESNFKISSIFNFESNTIISHDKNNSFLINRDNLTKFLIELKTHIENNKFNEDVLLIPEEVEDKYIKQTYINKELDKYYVYTDRSYRELRFFSQSLYYIYKGEIKIISKDSLINYKIRDRHNRPLGNITSFKLDENICKIEYSK